MRKLAVPLITFLALALLVGTIAYVVSAQAPATLTLPASVSIPTATPALTLEPMVSPDPSPEPTPTAVPAATPTPTPSPAPTLPPAMGPEPTGDNVVVHHGEQPPYALTGAGYDRVQLVNNGTATDPTWQQLESFLLADKTDEKAYVTGTFMCGAFAEELYNNAEAAGIKAAWVSVTLEGESEGHALNAFYTTDKGLVYIDCGGKTAQEAPQSVGLNSTLPEGPRVYGEASSWDKVAYVAVGKELGFVSLDVASCPQYVCYEDYEQRKASFEAALNDYNQKAQAYNSEVVAFNEWVAGRVFIEGTSDAARAHQWSEELGQERDNLTALAVTLDEQGKSLGAFWQTLGIVSKVDIYW
jgi:hypothetical protein